MRRAANAQAVAAWGVCTAVICGGILAQIAGPVRQEDWPEESVALRIEQTLGKIFEQQSYRAAHLSADFRGTPLVPHDLKERSFDSEVRVYTGSPAVNRTVPPGSFDLEVRKLFVGYRLVGKTAFRVTQLEPRLRGGGFFAQEHRPGELCQSDFTH
jgi:hypothetical protein